MANLLEKWLTTDYKNSYWVQLLLSITWQIVSAVQCPKWWLCFDRIIPSVWNNCQHQIAANFVIEWQTSSPSLWP